MTLRELVTRYLAIGGGYNVSVALAAFGLTPEETGTVFSGYDEDYHISRFLHFSCTDGARFVIDGEPATHIAVDKEIESIL
jgi:hypothetical protein